MRTGVDPSPQHDRLRVEPTAAALALAPSSRVPQTLIGVAFLCMGLAGCAALPAVGLNLAAQGAQGLVALTLGPMVAMQEASETDRCSVFTGKGISVTESLETVIPIDEGEVNLFEQANWRPEFAREGYPQFERSRTPTEGALAITGRSVLFVPLAGTTSIRVPYELVQDVEFGRNAVTGEPRSMIVRSCYGRFDIVTFRQQQPDNSDSGTTTSAAAQLKARVAAFRATADN